MSFAKVSAILSRGGELTHLNLHPDWNDFKHDGFVSIFSNENFYIFFIILQNWHQVLCYRLSLIVNQH